MMVQNHAVKTQMHLFRSAETKTANITRCLPFFYFLTLLPCAQPVCLRRVQKRLQCGGIVRIDLAEAAAAGNQWIDAAALGRNDAAIGYGRLRLVIDHLMQRAEAFPKRRRTSSAQSFAITADSAV